MFYPHRWHWVAKVKDFGPKKKWFFSILCKLDSTLYAGLVVVFWSADFPLIFPWCNLPFWTTGSWPWGTVILIMCWCFDWQTLHNSGRATVSKCINTQSNLQILCVSIPLISTEMKISRISELRVIQPYWEYLHISCLSKLCELCVNVISWCMYFPSTSAAIKCAQCNYAKRSTYCLNVKITQKICWPFISLSFFFLQLASAMQHLRHCRSLARLSFPIAPRCFCH